ncbi:hypothetical protein [Streptomyces zingiberis]|uniref:Uncharacterized protein n=1 Tax=Streptomyces zingiberis TaxID=2053010 RepID=A0ABX1BT20_9ACTN|nr:hypothetical protein [Streptomyces zingiberis]NJQ00857.1 hypothetical protein [Streptomyces zingiberis]
MNHSGRTTVTVLLTVICGLLLSVLGLCLEWPGWAWGLLLVVLAGAPVAVTWSARRRPALVPPEMVAHLPLEPVERRELRVSGVTLPSKWADYDFLFTATVRWCPTGAAVDEPVVNPGGLAAEAVIARARAITEQREPGRAGLVQHELNGALGLMRPDATGHLRAMAESVTLTLSERDQERLDKLAAVRKDEAVWQHERKYEQSRREYLGKDVLRNTGSAVVWWLAKNDDQVERTVGDIGLLAQLSSAARDEDIPERYHALVPHLASAAEAAPVAPPLPGDEWHGRYGAGNGVPRADGPGEHLDAFLRSVDFAADAPQRLLLAEQIASLLEQDGRPDAAEALRLHFDLTPRPPGPAPDDPGDPGDPDEPSPFGGDSPDSGFPNAESSNGETSWPHAPGP